MSVVRLEYRNVTMRFADSNGAGALTAVRGVSFSVHDAEVVSLIGPTGCGKSTLLNIGSGLTPPSEGSAFVDGERVAGPNAQVAIMLQKDLLLPWRTVAENVTFGVEIQGLPLKECKRRAAALLANFKLAEFSGHYPHQLSGGMRQRVALARTLAVDPHVLLLDEPFSAVDAQTRMVLQRDLAQTLKQANKTALLITHDLAEAVTLSDRVLVMSRRPGTIIDEIRIEMPHLWMGFTVYPKILVAILIVFFPVMVNVLTAVRNVDPDLINLARAFKASRAQIFWRIEFPSSMPPMFAGLRIGSTLAVVGVVVGELVGGNLGLGYLLTFGEGQANTPLVFVSIVMLTLVGGIAYLIVILIERRVLHYLPARGVGRNI
jgi:NitT/TauT family transport system ATP-binding protein